MTGIYISPDFRMGAIAGQVPKLDPALEMSPFAPRNEVIRIVDRDDVVLSVDAVAQNLGLPADQEVLVRGVVERALTASNELTFRQELMTSLIEGRVEGGQRRAILARAVALYRGTRPAPEPEPVARITVRRRQRQRLGPVVLSGRSEGDPEVEKGGNGIGAHLRAAVRKLIADAGPTGLPSTKLAEYVRKHSSQSVTQVLREIGVEVHNHRIFLKEMSKSEPEQMPRGAAQGGGADDPRSDPVGARKVWNKRIVEKQPDGKWHVVGHVAGLEDPKAVPQLDPQMLTREQLAHLLQQLIRVHQARHGGSGVEKADRLPGGRADGRRPESFAPDALAEGTRVEREHTDDPEVAREIAMDHLTEDPDYYRKLRQVESGK